MENKEYIQYLKNTHDIKVDDPNTLDSLESMRLLLQRIQTDLQTASISELYNKHLHITIPSNNPSSVGVWEINFECQTYQKSIGVVKEIDWCLLDDQRFEFKLTLDNPIKINRAKLIISKGKNEQEEYLNLACSTLILEIDIHNDIDDQWVMNDEHFLFRWLLMLDSTEFSTIYDGYCTPPCLPVMLSV